MDNQDSYKNSGTTFNQALVPALMGLSGTDSSISAQMANNPTNVSKSYFDQYSNNLNSLISNIQSTQPNTDGFGGERNQAQYSGLLGNLLITQSVDPYIQKALNQQQSLTPATSASTAPATSASTPTPAASSTTPTPTTSASTPIQRNYSQSPDLMSSLNSLAPSLTKNYSGIDSNPIPGLSYQQNQGSTNGTPNGFNWQTQYNWNNTWGKPTNTGLNSSTQTTNSIPSTYNIANGLFMGS
jgi:hypothetical protein